MSTEVSEKYILATIMRKPDVASKAFSRVPVEHFDPPMNLVAEAIQGLRVGRKPVDPSTVTDEMRRRATLGRLNPAYVHEVANHFIDSTSIDYHLDVVADDRRLRKLSVIGEKLTMASSLPDVDAAQLAHSTAEQIQSIIDNIDAEQDVTTETLRDLLASEDEPHDWVVPGLLERSDRLILTGSEGLGKSTLFRQMAVCAAAGINPFTQERHAPQRVLYIDVENSRRQAKRALRPLALAARQHGSEPEDNLFIECRQEGIDLTRPEDELWFISRIVAIQPSIVFTGPIYKLHQGDPNEEKPARKVVAVLDRGRAAADCAMVIEAHTGHATEGLGGPRKVRPYGASLWLRWPEFGYGIRPTQDFTEDNRNVEFVSWRGDREVRQWPTHLRKGGTWPWQIATNPNGTWTPYPTPERHTA